MERAGVDRSCRNGANPRNSERSRFRALWTAGSSAAPAGDPGAAMNPKVNAAVSVTGNLAIVRGTQSMRTRVALDRSGWIGWFPLMLLPAAAIAERNLLPPWAFMWLLALAIFAGCKWATFWRAYIDGV